MDVKKGVVGGDGSRWELWEWMDGKDEMSGGGAGWWRKFWVWV